MKEVKKVEKRFPEHIKRYNDLKLEFSDRVLELLDQYNISQKQLARKMGMKESQLSRIIAASENLTLKTIARIETALEEKIISVGNPVTKIVLSLELPADFSKYNILKEFLVWQKHELEIDFKRYTPLISTSEDLSTPVVTISSSNLEEDWDQKIKEFQLIQDAA